MICPECRRPVSLPPSRLHGVYELICKCGRQVVARDDERIVCECGREIAVAWPDARFGGLAR